MLPRSHFDIFGGDAFPAAFVNQGADPFLFQLYRRFSASVYLPCTDAAMRNTIGGPAGARYDKQHVEWLFELLDSALATVRGWLQRHGMAAAACGALTIDVLVPTMRCQPEFLRPIVQLTLLAVSTAEGEGRASICSSAVPHEAKGRASASANQIHSIDAQSAHACAHLQADRAGRNPAALTTRPVSVGVVIVLDDPARQDALNALRSEFEHDSRVRLRMHDSNLGASAARNRCLAESGAEWTIFLDDDVSPSSELVSAYAHAIEAHGARASGFVGSTGFPRPTTARQRGVHLAGVTFFWGIADVLQPGEHVPWGVTASLCTRRVRQARFSTAYPKTGGGEDVAFCNELTRATGLPLLPAPAARAVHPYWNDGAPALSRFWHWAHGDGLLLDEYPDLTYAAALNATEVCVVLVLCNAAAAVTIVAVTTRWSAAAVTVSAGAAALIVVLLVDWLLDTCGLLRRIAANDSSDVMLVRANCVSGMRLPEVMAAIFQAKLVERASECGRLWGHCSRGPACVARNFGRRYMWWGTERQSVIQEEQRRALRRAAYLCEAAVSAAALVVLAAAVAQCVTA